MAGGSGHVIISSYSSDNGLLITTHHLSQTFFCGRVLLMSNVLGVIRGARLYTAGYAKQSFLHSAVSAF